MRVMRKRWSHLTLIGAALCVIAGAIPAQVVAADCSIKPASLLCEYLVQPQGLDVEHPRLSWQLSASHSNKRGLRQTGYRILVATSEQLLRSNAGDLWDSGNVHADESVNISYAGKSLQSGQECFWKVQVLDEKGTSSPWSEPSQWSMGLLN